jgi:osmotically-inducible protein OsmY
MNPLKRFSALFLAVILVSAAGCITMPAYEGPGEHVTEKSWITTKVNATLLEDSQVNAAATL